MASVPQRLGDLLLARRALSPDQLGTALAEQQRRPEPLGQILLRLGFVTENHLLEAFGHAVHDSAVPGARLRPEAAARTPGSAPDHAAARGWPPSCRAARPPAWPG